APPARAQPRCARGDPLLAAPRHPRSGGHAAPRRGQRQPRSALPRRTAAADRGGCARYRCRPSQQHQRDRQSRKADASRSGRRHDLATEVSEMTRGLPTRSGLDATPKGGNMQYVLLIYQGTAWAEIPHRSAEEKESLVAEYAAINEAPGVTPGGPLGLPEHATTVRIRDGEAEITDG